MNLRRSLAAGTVGLLAIAVLTACGFNYPTDRISNLTVGTDYRDGNVAVLNAVVVSAAGNGGTFVATLVNNTDTEQQVTGITGSGKVTQVDVQPVTIKPNGLVNLADEGGFAVSGTFGIGDFLDLTVKFGDGTTADMEVPVVAAADEWAGLDTATPSASPQRLGRLMTYTLVLLRHGESLWNAENLFTGWVDVDLSEKGRAEALHGGEQLRDAGILPDVVHTSLLRRAITTANSALDVVDRHWIPVRRSWRLNERHYGALQGKNKKQTLEQYGEEQFMLWRRSFDVPPPPIDDDDEFSQAHDLRYADLGAELPRSECLKDVIARMLPYWDSAIADDLRADQTVLIAAHGNSLRAIVKHLDDISDDDIAGLNIPTGMPLVYELDESLRPTVSGGRYLDPDAAAAAAAAVANQGR